MGIGGGHMMDFNNRTNNNRQLRKKDKFKSSVGYLYEKNNIKVNLKKSNLSDEEKQKIRLKIKKRIQNERKIRKYKILLLSFVLLMCIVMTLYFLKAT